MEDTPASRGGGTGMTGRWTPAASRRAFTMTEAIISMFLLALLVAGFTAAYPYTAQSILRAKHMDLAVNACQVQLEYWRDAGYAALPAIPSGSSYVETSFTAPSELSQATGTTRFTYLDDNLAVTTTDDSRKRVDATITWTGNGLDRGTVTLSTLVTNF